jgi:hypothetical protein
VRHPYLGSTPSISIFSEIPLEISRALIRPLNFEYRTVGFKTASIASNTQAIALYSFAQAHAPLPEFLALPPAIVPLALPSTMQLRC